MRLGPGKPLVEKALADTEADGPAGVKGAGRRLKDHLKLLVCLPELSSFGL